MSLRPTRTSRSAIIARTAVSVLPECRKLHDLPICTLSPDIRASIKRPRTTCIAPRRFSLVRLATSTLLWTDSGATVSRLMGC